MPYIIHHHKGAPARHYLLEGELRIGRGDSNQIQVDDPTVSSDHAVIEAIPGGSYKIRDLESTNGILFKGEKVSEHIFNEDDFVVLGMQNFQFVAEVENTTETTAKIKKSWIPGVFFTR